MKSVNCACVLYGTKYSIVYVENLYNMLQRNCSYRVNLHVLTEADRQLPDHVIKHSLEEIPAITSERQYWWYKMQLFGLRITGPVLYLDLDTVLVNNIDWVWHLNPDKFYAIRDFKYLWKPATTTINSSIMIWNPEKYNWILDHFNKESISKIIKQYPGDQDYISTLIVSTRDFEYLPADIALSWRWQAVDGGFDYKTRKYKQPNAGTSTNEKTSFLVFHGKPKPHEVPDVFVQKHWNCGKYK